MALRENSHLMTLDLGQPQRAVQESRWYEHAAGAANTSLLTSSF